MLWRRWRSLRYMSDDLEIFSLSHVQALWAYSEIAGSNFAHLYDHARDIKSLRAKRREGVAFIEFNSRGALWLGVYVRLYQASLNDLCSGD